MTIQPPDTPGPGRADDADVPPEAAARLATRSSASALSIPDLAACLEAGLEPVGLVQGFCAMQWAFYGAGSPYLQGASLSSSLPHGAYVEQWSCPHGFVSAEHRMWGQNYEQPWVEAAWAQGFGSAFQRMLEEAADAGAHGVIGVVDTSAHVADLSIVEFHLLGTAVVVRDAPPPAGGQPWSTYLAGMRLTKLLEAGMMPVSVVASMVSVRVWASCVTEFLSEGQAYGWGGSGSAGTAEIEQVSRARAAARSLARQRIRDQLGADELHGARSGLDWRELGQGDEIVECTLRGTRVRRFKEVDPLTAPRPTVQLG